MALDLDHIREQSIRIHARHGEMLSKIAPTVEWYRLTLAQVVAELEQTRASLGAGAVGANHANAYLQHASASSAAKDWRVGLTCKPKMRTHELYYEQGEIVAVQPSGTGGIHDKDGVLVIRMQSGRVMLAPADEWVTVDNVGFSVGSVGNCQIIGFTCTPSDLCSRCKGSGSEPLTPDGSDPCCCCDHCFDLAIGWSTGIEPGTASSLAAMEFVGRPRTACQDGSRPEY